MTEQFKRVADLRAGEAFTPAFGGHYTYDRPHASHGVHMATRADGSTALFGECATVSLGHLESGWLTRGLRADREVA